MSLLDSSIHDGHGASPLIPFAHVETVLSVLAQLAPTRQALETMEVDTTKADETCPSRSNLGSKLAETIEPTFRGKPQDPILERLSNALEAAEGGSGQHDGIYADAVRLAILAKLFSRSAKPDRPEATSRTKTALPKWRLKRVIDYVDANLADKITLASLAQAVGLSRMHFAAQFRAAMGVPPHEFVLRRRIECTQRLLLETDSTLVDIALSVGFQTQAHFTTVFKRFVGDTPHRWRSATLAKTQSMVASATNRDSLIPSSMQLLERHEYHGRTR